MKSTAVVFPFDLFGSPGTSAGAQLLGDAMRELIEDTRAENRPTRSHAFRDRLKIREFTFETLAEIDAWRQTARQAVREVWARDEFLLYFSGNHLGVLPVYEELGSDALVIQLDAHLDIYNLSDCTDELSHGNFLLHAASELPPIINIGHRDLFLTAAHIRKHYRLAISALESIPLSHPELMEALAQARRVFLDIDCDVFDPAFFPATPHPMPCGPPPLFVPQIIRAVGIDRLAGVAFSEFEPGRDRNDQSLNALGWLLEWILLERHENDPGTSKRKKR